MSHMPEMEDHNSLSYLVSYNLDLVNAGEADRKTDHIDTRVREARKGLVVILTNPDELHQIPDFIGSF